MNKLYEQAKALREAASRLEDEADALELPVLMEKYKYVVGSCWRLKEKSGDDVWDEYVYVKGIESINVNQGSGTETIYLNIFKFIPNHPWYKSQYIGHDQTYLHHLENYAKKISMDEFTKAFTKFKESIS